MSVSPVDAATPGSADRKTSIAQDFDTFLRLLTTQLANQDPLSPMDSNQFTQQLVQFANVEQVIATNTKLDTLVSLMSTDGLGAGAAYLGREVEADGATATLAKTGTASFEMTTTERPATLFVNVFDERGERIATLSPPPADGEQTVVWDGRADDGFRAPEGTYRFAVDARDLAGAPIEVSTRLKGRVVAVENVNGELLLDLGDRTIPLRDVTAVRAPDTDTTDNEGASS